MTRDEYVRDICEMSGTASFVPFKPNIRLGNWKPKVADCHGNADYWVKHYPGHVAIRGWIALMEAEPDPVVYTAHSVVCGPDGELFDITPLYNAEDIRRGKFISHVGDDATFLAMRTGMFINLACQGNCPAPPLDPVLALQQYAPDPEKGL